ncbi:MAG: hypothetical protein IKU82_05605 [Clostridia bacterium]|nr:hypothetical protein [Clostridia bacterium]
MSEENKIPLTEVEDISSTSEQFRAKKDPIAAYTNGLYKNLGNVIKAISFLISFAVIMVGFAAAFFLFTKTALSATLGLLIVIVFTVVAACLFFPIYGIGHIVCQNNEILKSLNK